MAWKTHSIKRSIVSKLHLCLTLVCCTLLIDTTTRTNAEADVRRMRDENVVSIHIPNFCSALQTLQTFFEIVPIGVLGKIASFNLLGFKPY